MTRQQKIEKKKARAAKRAQKHNDRYRAETASLDGLPRASLRGNAWPDPNSPTGWTQRCSYWATCQAPCNGDC